MIKEHMEPKYHSFKQILSGPRSIQPTVEAWVHWGRLYLVFPHNLFSHPLNCITKLNFIPGSFTKVRSFTPFPQERFCQCAPRTHQCLRWPFTLLQFWLRGCNFPYAISQGTSCFCLCAPSVLLFKHRHNFLLGRKPHILQALGILTAQTEHFTSTVTSALCEARWEREGSRFGGVIPAHRWLPHTPCLCPALPSPSLGIPRLCFVASVPVLVRRAVGLDAVVPRKGSAPKLALS